MPYPELILRDAPPPGAGLPGRADVALFAGFVGRRATPLPDGVRAALVAAGWAGKGPFARSDAAVEALLDVPVAVTSWAAFDALYAWDERPLTASSARTVACPLGLAVRSFFAEGGIKAWVVRAGDPPPLLDVDDPDAARDTVVRPLQADPAALRAARRQLLSWDRKKHNPPVAGQMPPDADLRVPLIPGLDRGAPPSASDPGTWCGVAHIWGIDDAAMLSLPDLAEVFAPQPEALSDLAGPPPVPEAWKPCAPASPSYVPDGRNTRPTVSAPRLDRQGYAQWGAAIAHLIALLGTPRGAAHRRDVMLMASLPLPRHDSDLAGYEGAPLRLLSEKGLPKAGVRLLDTGWVGSARLQLGYPWVGTAASDGQPEGIEAPEGVLMGAIARSALAQGAFRSAASSRLASVRSTVPNLRSADIRTSLDGGAADWTGDLLCLIVQKPQEFTLISDATTSQSRDWRAGGVSRLMGIILRAARWLGQDRLFEPAGEHLWSEITLDFESFLDNLWQLGALAGGKPSDAYSVRCDASVMSQADIDAGRTIVQIMFTAAQPVQRITVTLALSEGGGAQLAEAA